MNLSIVQRLVPAVDPGNTDDSARFRPLVQALSLANQAPQTLLSLFK